MSSLYIIKSFHDSLLVEMMKTHVLHSHFFYDSHAFHIVSVSTEKHRIQIIYGKGFAPGQEKSIQHYTCLHLYRTTQILMMV